MQIFIFLTSSILILSEQKKTAARSVFFLDFSPGNEYKTTNKF